MELIYRIDKERGAIKFTDGERVRTYEYDAMMMLPWHETTVDEFIKMSIDYLTEDFGCFDNVEDVEEAITKMIKKYNNNGILNTERN